MPPVYNSLPVIIFFHIINTFKTVVMFTCFSTIIRTFAIYFFEKE